MLMTQGRNDRKERRDSGGQLHAEGERGLFLASFLSSDAPSIIPNPPTPYFLSSIDFTVTGPTDTAG